MKYKCAMCKGVFNTENDAEARAERKKLWGEEVQPTDDIVCDDCWQKMQSIYSVEEFLKDNDV